MKIMANFVTTRGQEDKSIVPQLRSFFSFYADETSIQPGVCSLEVQGRVRVDASQIISYWLLLDRQEDDAGKPSAKNRHPSIFFSSPESRCMCESPGKQRVVASGSRHAEGLHEERLREDLNWGHC
jgi:hypothetical protein